MGRLLILLGSPLGRPWATLLAFRHLQVAFGGPRDKRAPDCITFWGPQHSFRIGFLYMILKNLTFADLSRLLMTLLDFGSPLCRFWSTFTHLWSTLVDFWSPLGRHWATFCRPWVDLGRLFVSLGSPLDAFGRLSRTETERENLLRSFGIHFGSQNHHKIMKSSWFFIYDP